MASSFPDYYSLLNVNPKSTNDEIRTAYKKESLKCHPDRLANASAAEKDRAKEKFQVRRLLSCIPEHTNKDGYRQ